MNAHALSILVADDDPMSLGPMREALLGAGYAVEFVEDVDAALETLGATRAPILIADWLLPGGGGAELCRAIRRWVHANEGLYALMARVEPQPDHPDVGATDRALLDLFLRPLGQLGVPVDRRVHAIRALRSAVHGFVLLESARQFQLAADSEVSFELLIDAVIRGLVNAG